MSNRSPIFRGCKQFKVVLLLLLLGIALLGCTDNSDQLRVYALSNGQLNPVAMQEGTQKALIAFGISIVKAVMAPTNAAAGNKPNASTKLSKRVH